MNENVKGVEYREHPHKFAEDNHLVWTIMCPPEIKRPKLKLDVNTERDYRYITKIYEAIYSTKPEFSAIDVVRFLDGENDLEKRPVSA